MHCGEAGTTGAAPPYIRGGRNYTGRKLFDAQATDLSIHISGTAFA
jgi:hypothetical protein